MSKKLKVIIPSGIVLILILAFLLFTGNYYHSDETAASSLRSDAAVTVVRTDYGWLFDGPSPDTAFIFYPGAKVEAPAYAPFLHRLAEAGMDACLVEMPFRLAFFGGNKAEHIMELYDYTSWYIGGHSLGGAIAANYAASHGDKLKGLILCAAYPTKALPSDLTEISIYGSEDRILNLAKLAEGYQYAPEDFIEYEIPGGNHAQFGNYGLQKGDGTAKITPEEQQRTAVELIMNHISLLKAAA